MHNQREEEKKKHPPPPPPKKKKKERKKSMYKIQTKSEVNDKLRKMKKNLFINREWDPYKKISDREDVVWTER